MKSYNLKTVLSLTLLSTCLAYADEPTHQQTSNNQAEKTKCFPRLANQAKQLPLFIEQENKALRFSVDLDMFWAPSKLDITYPVCDTNNNFVGHYRADWKNRRQYEGLRFAWESLSLNAFYLQATLLTAIGTDHRKYYVNASKIEERTEGLNLWVNMDCGIGYTFAPLVSSNFHLNVFAGPGYHFVKKNESDAEWQYAMAGLKISQHFSETVSLGMNFKTMYSYNIQDHHRMTYFETLDKKHFWGFEFELPLTINLGKTQKYALQLNPYILKYNLNSLETIFGGRVGLGITY